MQIVHSKAVSFGMFTFWLKVAYWGKEHFSFDAPQDLVEKFLRKCEEFQQSCVDRMVDGYICWYATPLDFGAKDWGFSCPIECKDTYLLVQHRVLSALYRQIRAYHAVRIGNLIYF